MEENSKAYSDMSGILSEADGVKLYDGRLWIGIIWRKKGLVAGCTVHVNELFFSTNTGNLFVYYSFLDCHEELGSMESVR
jgi:hypothetical protein